jgi:uncharacterized protein (DUF1330 family)
MKTHHAAALAMLAGFGLGAISITGISAQGKSPSAYAIIDTSEVKDAELYKTIATKGPPTESAGGHYLARTGNIIALHGDAPKRFLIIAFDSVEKAKAWDALPASTEIHAIADKAATQRRFIVEGME